MREPVPGVEVVTLEAYELFLVTRKRPNTKQ